MSNVQKVNELKSLLLDASEKMKELRAEGVHIEFAFNNGELTAFKAFAEMKLSS